jgi:DNA polymerase-3 subunit gamma/tau
MIAAVLAQDSAAALRVVAELLDQGHDLRAYSAELVEHVRNLMVAAVVPPSPGVQGGPDLRRLQGLIDLSEEEIRQVVAEAQAFTVEQLQELFRICAQAEDAVRVSQHPRFVLEVAVVRATRLLGTGGQVRSPAVTPAPASAAPASPPVRPRDIPAPATSRTEPKAPSSATVRPVSGPSGGAEIRSAAQPTPLPEPLGALNWEQVVERVTSEHPNIGAFLEQGTLVGIEGNQVTVGYPKSASLAYGRMQKEENLRVVMGTCEELAGRPVRVRIVELTDGQAVAPTMAEIRAAKDRDQKHALLEQARSHPVVKQALAVFGGELVEVRQASSRKESGS